MIKTPHRLLHDALSKEDYARVLVNMREQNNGKPIEFLFNGADTSDDALFEAFIWDDSNELHEYWQRIYLGLKHD